MQNILQKHGIKASCVTGGFRRYSDFKIGACVQKDSFILVDILNMYLSFFRDENGIEIKFFK